MRDDNLIHELLLKLDGLSLEPGALLVLTGTEPVVAVDGYSAEQIAYHLEYLRDEGLIDSPGSQPMLGATFRRLSRQGHDIVNSIRSAARSRRSSAQEKTSRMPAPLDDLLEEYDALSNDVQGSRYQFFQSNLERWFWFLDGSFPFSRTVLQLESGVDFDGWYEQCRSTMRSMVGSATLDWPSESRKQLGLKLQLCRNFSTGQMQPYDFCRYFLYSAGDDFDSMVFNIVTQIFAPMASELRRVLRREAAGVEIGRPAYQHRIASFGLITIARPIARPLSRLRK